MTINKEKRHMKRKIVVLLPWLRPLLSARHGSPRAVRTNRFRRSGRYGRARKHGPEKTNRANFPGPRPPRPQARQTKRAESSRPPFQDKRRAPSGQAIGYASPLNIPLRLSANYGELRGGHFHAGIDIKTQGVIGKPVFAMDDGYVSRINVSPSGFGKALYITHPDGRMTVYGHLERFTEPIEAYVHELQYARKTFALDFAPPETRFPVKRGERSGCRATGVRREDRTCIWKCAKERRRDR